MLVYRDELSAIVPIRSPAIGKDGLIGGHFLQPKLSCMQPNIPQGSVNRGYRATDHLCLPRSRQGLVDYYLFKVRTSHKCKQERDYGKCYIDSFVFHFFMFLCLLFWGSLD